MRSLRTRSSADDTEQLFGFLVKDETMWEELSTPLNQQERVVMNYGLTKMRKVLTTGSRARQMSHGVVAKFIPDFLTTMANAIMKNPSAVTGTTITCPFTDASVTVSKDFLTQNFKEPDIEFLSVVKETGVMFLSSVEESDKNEDSVTVKLMGSWEAISKANILLQKRAQNIAFSKIDDAINDVLNDGENGTKNQAEGSHSTQKVSCLEMLRGTRINKPHPLLYKVLKRKKKTRLLMKKKRRKLNMLKKINENGTMSPPDNSNQSESSKDEQGFVGSVENKQSAASTGHTSVSPVIDSSIFSVGENAVDVNPLDAESYTCTPNAKLIVAQITPPIINSSTTELTASHKPVDLPDSNKDSLSSVSVVRVQSIVSSASSTDSAFSGPIPDLSPPESPDETAGIMSFNISSNSKGMYTAAALSRSNSERNVLDDTDMITRPPQASSPGASPGLMSFNISRNSTNVCPALPSISAPYTVSSYLPGIKPTGALDVHNVSNNFSGPGTMMEMFSPNGQLHSVAPPISYNPFQRNVTPDLPTMFIPTVICDDPSKAMGPPYHPQYSDTNMHHMVLHPGVVNAHGIPMNIHDNAHPGMRIHTVPQPSLGLLPHETGYTIIRHPLPQPSQFGPPHFGAGSLVNTPHYANAVPTAHSINMMNAGRSSESPHIALPTIFAVQEHSPPGSAVEVSPRAMPLLQPAFSPERRPGTLVSRQMPDLHPMADTSHKKDSTSLPSRSDPARVDLLIKMPRLETMRKPPNLQLCTSPNTSSPVPVNEQLIINPPILERSPQISSSAVSENTSNDSSVTETTGGFMIISESEAASPQYSVQAASNRNISELSTLGYTVRKTSKSAGYSKHVISQDKISTPNRRSLTPETSQLSEIHKESASTSFMSDETDENSEILPGSEMDTASDNEETSPPRDIRCGGRNELPMKKEVVEILDTLLKLRRTSRGRFRCPLFAQCKYLAAHKKILREHYIRSHIGCAWECEVCLEPFSQRYKLREHMDNVHPDVDYKQTSS